MGHPEGSPPPLCATVQVREFLGAAGFCQIWIPNYSLSAKLFYKATKVGRTKTHGIGEKAEKKAFKKN
jgi:hypothetical protein